MKLGYSFGNFGRVCIDFKTENLMVRCSIEIGDVYNVHEVLELRKDSVAFGYEFNDDIIFARKSEKIIEVTRYLDDQLEYRLTIEDDKLKQVIKEILSELNPFSGD